MYLSYQTQPAKSHLGFINIPDKIHLDVIIRRHIRVLRGEATVGDIPDVELRQGHQFLDVLEETCVLEAVEDVMT